MKKSVLFLLVAFFTLGFVACSDDDDEVYHVTNADVDGTYLGTMDVKAPFGGVELGATGVKQKIYVTKTGENQVKLQLKNFVFKGIPVGDIEVEQVSVSKENEAFVLKGAGKLTLIVGGCDVTVDGTIDASGNCAVMIGVDVTGEGEGMNFVGLKVSVDFKGKRLEKDLSSEALITAFSFNSDSVTNVVIVDGMVQFYLLGNPTNLKFKPTITISAGATITPASDVEQDFSSPVKYTVTSEDGIVSQEYTVSQIGKEIVFGFEKWTSVVGGVIKGYEIPEGRFGSTNDGIEMVNQMVESLSADLVSPYCIEPENQAKVGDKCVLIQTVSLAKQKNKLMELVEEDPFFAFIAEAIPYNTAGSLFLGSFKTNTDNTLLSTKFGIPFIGKPVKFSGWYKYTPGEELRNKQNEVVAEQVDECAIFAVLYEAKDAEGKEVTLTGEDINTSEYVILKAELSDGSAKADWTKFDLDFVPVNNKQYNAEQDYKFAFVCTSSKAGDQFIAAPGSTLIVDDLKIIAE